MKRTAKSDITVADPATGETSAETSDAIWQRWARERTERERGEKMQAQARADAYSERAIYSIEIARAVAQHQAPGVCPSWRELRDLIRKEYGRILREQPEMRQRDVKAREQIIVALFNGLPAHLHGALSELRTVIELVGMAREATTFLLGFEIGRASGRQDALRDPRVMLAPEPQRRALPAPDNRSDIASSEPLRLHAADENGGAQ
jgi:hypothetical protein